MLRCLLPLLQPPGLLAWPPVAGWVKGRGVAIACRDTPAVRPRKTETQWALRGGVSDLAPFPLGAPKSGCISVHKFSGPPSLGGKSVLSAGSPRCSYKFRYPPASPKIRREFFPPLLSVHFRRPHPPSTPSTQQADHRTPPRPPDSTHRQPLPFSSCALIRQAPTQQEPSELSVSIKTRTRTQAST
ncbi:hypothetical protein B0H65DRAFT_27249 [Neurospora tetraspora]|uniref:Questionable protein n=1 Tax=Neurospora tetraspora TaxID=94610 RepID=A0AAE0JNK2_9PEZI|nr:hypothetical protein B0H65DRAFT_27249 [Neurospora tetraspora]